MYPVLTRLVTCCYMHTYIHTYIHTYTRTCVQNCSSLHPRPDVLAYRLSHNRTTQVIFIVYPGFLSKVAPKDSCIGLRHSSASDVSLYVFVPSELFFVPEDRGSRPTLSNCRPPWTAPRTTRSLPEWHLQKHCTVPHYFLRLSFKQRFLIFKFYLLQQ